MNTKGSFRRWLVILGVLLLVGGCQFDPSRHVHSAQCPPDHTTDDGITWVALKLAGDNDLWFYVPKTIAILEGWRPAPQGLQVDVLIKGQIYRITRSGSGYAFDGRIESDLAANQWLVMVTILLGLFFVYCFIRAMHAQVALESARDRANAAEAKARKCREHQSQNDKAIERQREELKQKERSIKQAQAQERAVLDEERRALEDRIKTQTLAAREVQLKREPPTAEEWKKMSQAVRAEQFRGSGSSREVTVQYFLDPKTSGAMVFDWEITLDRPQPLTLVVFRDGRKIKAETGTFKGRIPVRLLKRTKRYRFVFKVMEGNREYPNPLLIELTAPPFDAWEEPAALPNKPSPDGWVAQQIEWMKKMGQWPADEEARKILMAKLQAEARDKFGEAE